MTVAARPSDIAALVLAAGSSRRMGPANKLLAQLRGRPIVAHVVDALRRCPQLGHIVVVTGHEHQAVRAATRAAAPGDDTGPSLTWVHNPDHLAGMGTSLAAGVAALPPGIRAVSICLGDMPLLAPDHVGALVESLDATTGPAICVPTYRGERGHPVLFSAHFFDALGQLGGDTGARRLLGQHPERVHLVPVQDPGVLADVDTPAALERLTRDA